ncbi:MAG TPA: HAD family phosphatase [Mycobacteriales bacterium]|nr:HAD family phosphatase [Mycobacteriales bacterium]
MRSAAAVLFDLDGLLVDSEPLWTRAEVELAASLGHVWDPALKAAIAGTRLELAVPTILTHYGIEPDADTVSAASEFLLARMAELFATDLPTRPGAVQLADAIRAAGVPIALVSSSYRRLVDAALAGLGEHRFDVTVAGDEVTHGKPDPEPYLRAAAGLGVRAGDCVVLEDAPAGVASGEAAGAIVVAVPDVVPIAPTPLRPVVATLAGIDLDWLLGLPWTLR